MRGQILSTARRLCRSSYPALKQIFTLPYSTSLKQRRTDLGYVNDFQASHFERILNTHPNKPNAVISTPDELEPYNVDYTGNYRGSSGLVLLPSTSEEMAEAMKLCYNWRLGVLPQGGNTSLVGSSTPTFDEVIMSTKRMNRILSIDPDTGTAVCEAGVIPSDLELALSDPAYDLVMPLDLGSWDICNIGGNASTNARGIRTLRYPDFRHSIIGIEAVLPNGEILNVLQGPHKDPIGVDLKHCFIGTEGIFGIITKVAIRCQPRPKSTEVALLTCDNYGVVMEVLRRARRDLAETLSAFEYMDYNALGVVERELNLRLPVPEKNNDGSRDAKRHAVFIEVSSNAVTNQAQTLMSEFIGRMRSLGLCSASILARNTTEFEKLWRTRKAVIDACKPAGLIYKFDIKISAHQLPELARLFEAITDDGRVKVSANGYVQREPDGGDHLAKIKDLIIFGQLPTGNIHVVATIDPDSWQRERLNSVESCSLGVPECVRRLETVMSRWLRLNNNQSSSTSGGFLSLSKEFGGKWMRWVHQLESFVGTSDFPGRDLQLALKKTWDPRGIMNPYKTWPFTNF